MGHPAQPGVRILIVNLNRRQFLILTATAAAGCTAAEPPALSPGAGQPRIVDAGPAAAFARDGVYDPFRDQGFFVIRNGSQLFALSAYCTHRRCKLAAEPDHTFFCKCHGSTFDPAGHVTVGPAKRNLPVYQVSVDEQGRLLVQIPPA